MTADAVDALLASAGSRGHRALVAGVVGRGGPVIRAWSRSGAAPTEQTLFEIGSLTKPFTGVLLADMHLNGEISLTDPLSEHLPSSLAPAWGFREPTLEELATHSTGLPNVPRGLWRAELAYSIGLRRADPWAAIDERAYAAAVAATRPGRRRGSMRYSSLGFGLLGDALARAAGEPFEKLLRRRVCLRLGMRYTVVTVPPESRGRLLEGHSRRGHPRPPIEDLMPAAGSLRSSGADMLRWLESSLEPSSEAPGPAQRLAQEPRLRVSKRFSMGLGWLIVHRRRRPAVVWHNGGTWGFRSFSGFVPSEGVGAFALSNTARSLDRLGFALLDAASIA